jgi:hypothetical protein
MLDVIFNRYLTAPTPGGWYDQIDPNGRVISKHMPTSTLLPCVLRPGGVSPPRGIAAAVSGQAADEETGLPERRARTGIDETSWTDMAAKFGTSGLRGLVGDLTDGTAAMPMPVPLPGISSLNANSAGEDTPHFHRARHACLKPRDRGTMRGSTERGRP